MLRSKFSAVLLILFLVGVPLTVHAQVEVENLVLNPSFEDESDMIDDQWVENGWLYWGQDAGLNSVIEIDEAEFIDGTRSLRTDPQATINWHFQAIYYPIAMDMGESYTYSFWAKAAEERIITVVMKDVNNVGSFGVTEFILTTEWSEYTATADAQWPSIKLEFHLAVSEASVWLDFVYVYEGEYVEEILPSEIGVQEAVEPANKLPIQWAEIKAR